MKRSAWASPGGLPDVRLALPVLEFAEFPEGVPGADAETAGEAEDDADAK